MQHRTAPCKSYKNGLWTLCLLCQVAISSSAQNVVKIKSDSSNKNNDTTKSILDINNTKLIKKANSILDTQQKKITNFISEKLNKVKDAANDKVGKVTTKIAPLEIEKPLPYERLLKTKYTLGRRAYQNTVSQYNFLFNAQEELNSNILKARSEFVDDFTSLLSFYDYDLSTIAKYSIDSIIYRCNANIVLHDLRSNWVDDAYLLLAKAYFFHKNFDTAGSILQFINYSFDEKENGMDVPIGSNLRNTKGKFSIATAENNRFFENVNVRNESMIWQARNYFEKEEYSEGISLLQLLASDAVFPKRLTPFLQEQLAYGYYLMELFDKSATALEIGVENAPDNAAKTRWYYLLGQLWQKADNLTKAYTWYKKANLNATNPIVSVYANINMISIESKNGNNNWEQLAYTLEKMIKKDRYKPYADIIYFEMAKLAIQNKGYTKANEWLIQSIKKNTNNINQKNKAFELLGNTNYLMNQFSIAKMAYDSVNGTLKTHPNYETIQARKKWLASIYSNDKIIKQEDSLQYIYTLDPLIQEKTFKNWQKRQQIENENLNHLFKEESSKINTTEDKSNDIYTTSLTSNNNDFYFDNKQVVSQGKQNFTQKWGDRPNTDAWRRKTNLITQQVNQSGYNNYQSTKTSSTTISADNKEVLQKQAASKEAVSYTMIQSPASLLSSKQNWNKASLSNAQTFLFQLNDFEKAYPLYLKIISNNIDSNTTERALLDLASHYLHNNLNEKSDSIIKIVEATYPFGFYVSKKTEGNTKKKKDASVVNDYKEAYFLSQIGNWDSLENLSANLNNSLKRTKWYTPFKFIQVKMYAQQKMDSIALVLLDSIILLNANEKIRDKAKNIIAELKNRKETESYLSNLELSKEITDEKTDKWDDSTSASSSPSTSNASSTPLITNNSTQKAISAAANKDSSFFSIAFTNDTTEPHYIALVTQKVSPTLVKEMQTAFTYLNNDEFTKQKLNVTYIQFNEQSYIVWIGPFENNQKAKTYINKVKPRLSAEIISFVPPKQYEIYLLSKSNILMIKDEADLKQYQQYMFKNIYKP